MSADTRPVLVGGARTPIGKLSGRLSHLSPVEIGAIAARAALARAGGIQPRYIVMGHVLQAANGQNAGRAAAIRAGVDRGVPGITLNDVCLASMSAIGLATSMVKAREADAVLVGGFDSMSQAPHAIRIRRGVRMGDAQMVDTMILDGLWCSIEDVGMGEVSDRENARLGITRADQDAFAAASHERAHDATVNGRLAGEITPIDGIPAEDEGIRPETTPGALARLRPAFTEGGTITAGNAAQMSDAGSAGLIASLGMARAAGVAPLCEIVDRAIVAGPDSSLHLRPAQAARKMLGRNGLVPGDVDLWEINEAFAGVVLASVRALGIDLDRVNVNGGAIALGHPLGASAFRLVLTLAHELRRRGVEYGVAALCGGGGQGQAMLIRAI